MLQLKAVERRCPGCGASVREVGFVAEARQAFRATPAGFLPGAFGVLAGENAHCILCGKRMPWTAEELTGVAA